jgi:cyclopropane fatty-acyl-phospholipid synthase-like methyltransferase
MSIYCDEVPKRALQTCPLCGEEHITIMHGIVGDLEDYTKKQICLDRGYSFCNCRNIFYTKYENIDKSVYDKRYYEKYNTENIKAIAQKEIEVLYPILKQHNKNIKTFLEIGCIRDYVLDYVAKEGVKTTGLDIFPHESKHELIVADFEDYQLLKNKYDVIHASHIFEHFEYPGAQLDKCKLMLNDGGLLYVAMPNTLFIDFRKNNPLLWDWHIQEHHILWNMDDWVEFTEEHGFKCVNKRQGLDMFLQTDNTWFWKQDFKTVFKNG